MKNVLLHPEMESLMTQRAIFCSAFRVVFQGVLWKVDDEILDIFDQPFALLGSLGTSVREELKAQKSWLAAAQVSTSLLAQLRAVSVYFTLRQILIEEIGDVKMLSHTLPGYAWLTQSIYRLKMTVLDQCTHALRIPKG